MPITVEINFPKRGINRRISGAFHRHTDGKIIVVHRGRIGGGRSGIGKKLFFENYTGRIYTLPNGEYDTEFAVIGDLDSPNFVNQVKEFVIEVDRIKKIIYPPISKVKVPRRPILSKRYR